MRGLNMVYDVINDIKIDINDLKNELSEINLVIDNLEKRLITFEKMLEPSKNNIKKGK